MPNPEVKNLKNLSLATLQEMLQRQTDLLKHTHTIEKLPDKGEALRKSRDAIVSAIQSTNVVEGLTDNLETITITQQLCTKEHWDPEPVFKPFAGLKHEKEVKLVYDEKHQVSAALEPAYKIQHTKPVKLEESLQLQVDKVNRMKVEQQEHFAQYASKLIEGAEKCPLDTYSIEDELIDLDGTDELGAKGT